MEKERCGLLLALCLACTPVASFADCEQNCAAAKADDATAEEKSGYTWQELVEKIPQLKQYELGFRRSAEKGASKDDGTYMVCQRVKAPDSRIRKRTCMPLNEYLAYSTEQRSAAERARLDLLDRQSIAPIMTLPRVPPSF